MTDLSQMIRWNANFVRGLAESVLNRAKVIRTSLTAGNMPEKNEAPKKSSKRTLKKAAVKRATTPGRRTKR